jgi:alkylation response protein AidB-like acyl-CoA dehydrogenase
MRSAYFTPDHDTFRASVRRFLEQEVAPQAERWETERRIPREIFRRMGELGFLGILYPPEAGGAGGDLFHAVAFLEELPRSRMGGFCAAVAVQQFMADRHIWSFGSEEQRRRWVVPSIEGRAVGALAVTEPDAGSDVAALRTRAERCEGGWLINGAKTFITNGADGDFYTLAAKTAPERGAAGISLFVVPAGTPGVRVARRLEKLGWHASDTAELSFEDVRLPADALVGEEQAGFRYLMQAFQLERLCSAAIGVGSSLLCLEETLAYVRQRQAFGRPLAKLQTVAHRLAELATVTEAARQLTLHAAWLLQHEHPAVRECSMAKLHATETAKRVTDECLQCFGGYGLMEEYPVARFYRDARPGTIVAGTSEIMRELISRLLLDER